MSTQRRILRLFNLAFGTLAMLAVALVSAFIAMRLAIHGREVDVPTFTGLSVDQARQRAHSKGLSLTIENRFYSSTVPAGDILAQSPSPNETVRRESEVRVTESLGGQRVPIPDVVGQTERTATLTLRHLTLDPGAVSYIPTDGPPDTVIAQTPPPNSQGVESPRVSLLVSQTADAPSAQAYVMPSLTGVSFAVAQLRAAAAGLHIIRPDPTSVPPPDTLIPTPTAPPAYKDSFFINQYPTGNVASQSPPAGHRVTRGEAVHVSMAQPSAAPPPATP